MRCANGHEKDWGQCCSFWLFCFSHSHYLLLLFKISYLLAGVCFPLLLKSPTLFLPIFSLSPDEPIGGQLDCFNAEFKKIKWDGWKLPIQLSKLLFTFEAQLNYFKGTWFAINLKLYWKSFQFFSLNERTTFKYSCLLLGFRKSFKQKKFELK